MEQPEIKLNHIVTKTVMTGSNVPLGGDSIHVAIEPAAGEGG